MAPDCQRELKAAEERLNAAQRRPVTSSADWAADVPERAGAYGIWDVKSGTLVYVGQTSDLRSRFRDLGRYENHSFRRTAAKQLRVARVAGEEALSQTLAGRYQIAYIEVAFGRAEIEEYLILRHRRTLLNKAVKRLLRGSQYGWVTHA